METRENIKEEWFFTAFAGDLGRAGGGVTVIVTVRDDALVGGSAGGGNDGARAVGSGIQVQVGETVLVERSGGRGRGGDGGGGASGGGGVVVDGGGVDGALVPLAGLQREEKEKKKA